MSGVQEAIATLRVCVAHLVDYQYGNRQLEGLWVAAEHERRLAALATVEQALTDKDARLTSALAASEEALHQMHEAKERLRDWEDDVRTVMAEGCGKNERHCTCVPPLRKAVAGLTAELDELVQAAQAETLAHQRVINGVTPKHPNWCADDAEAYNACFSAWHAASRSLADALARVTGEAT